MIISLIDVFYIGMIIMIFSMMAYMEVQIHTLKTMMEEHVKVDEKMCQIAGRLIKEKTKTL